MATAHNNAKENDFAKTVLMPGDPLRAKFIAETFLENPRLLMNVRNMLAYTGTYKGVPISVMSSGMGMPSIGIYSYELFKWFNVENIIRIGSAGAYSDTLKLQDVVVAKYAHSDSTYALISDGTTDKDIYPSKELNDIILQTAKEIGIGCKEAVVHSSDVFYVSDKVAPWQQYAAETGVECTEMESFALFHNAHMLNKKAACMLTISDTIYDGGKLTAEERQFTFTNMMKIALESAIKM